MSRSAVVAIVVAVIVVVGGTVLLETHNKSNDNSMNGMNMNNNQSSKSSDTTPTASNSVAIENFAFSPANITVKKGTSVTWNNKDSTTHTATSTSGPTSFDSGNLPNGKTYSFTFNTVGTYQYRCSIHSNMTGTVTVTE